MTRTTARLWTILLLVALLGGGVALEAFAGGKPVVAVSKFENKTSYRGRGVLDSGMADQLTDALMASGKFIVVERESLDEILKEQKLRASGATRQGNAAQSGQLESAAILIKGTVTEFEEKKAGSGRGLKLPGFEIKNDKSETHIGLTLRMIDSSTGQVLGSKRVEGSATAGGIKWGVSHEGVSYGQSGFEKTPLGKAMQVTIDNAVVAISEQLL